MKKMIRTIRIEETPVYSVTNAPAYDPIVRNYAYIRFCSFCSKDVSKHAWVISKEGKSSPLFFSKDWGLILLKDGLEKNILNKKEYSVLLKDLEKSDLAKEFSEKLKKDFLPYFHEIVETADEFFMNIISKDFLNGN